VLSAIELAGVPIYPMRFDEAVAACADHAAARNGGYICFVNVHSLTEATRHSALHEALRGAAFCFADGMPLVWLSHLKHATNATRIAGPDFMALMLERTRDYVHGFIGGAPGHAKIISERFRVRAQMHCPPVRQFSSSDAEADWRTFLDTCPNRESPSFVWVALGAPKQELWLAVVSKLAPTVTFFGVGAAFDFLAGSKPRAPRWLRRIGLEWTHRLATEPRRLWRRYLASNLRFIRIAVRELL